MTPPTDEDRYWFERLDQSYAAAWPPEVIAQAVFGEEAPRPHPQVGAVRRVRAPGELPEKLMLIREHKLTREMISTELLRKPEAWEALLPELPYIAMIRNLRNMERIGLLRPKRDIVQVIADRIEDAERIRNSRVHPIQLLSALMVYGRSQRGFMSFRGFFGERAGFWPANEPITTALEEAFYSSFANVQPTGLRTLIGLDVSSSMRGTWGSGTLEKIGLTAAIASTARGRVRGQRSCSRRASRRCDASCDRPTTSFW